MKAQKQLNKAFPNKKEEFLNGTESLFSKKSIASNVLKLKIPLQFRQSPSENLNVNWNNVHDLKLYAQITHKLDLKTS